METIHDDSMKNNPKTRIVTEDKSDCSILSSTKT